MLNQRHGSLLALCLAAGVALCAAACAGAGDGDTQKTAESAVSAVEAQQDALAGLQRREVGKPVSQFPDVVDLSTPEAATATWHRSWAREDAAAIVQMSPQPVTAAQVEGWLARRDRTKDEELLGARIVEVLTYRGELAVVVIHSPGRDKAARYPYRLRVLGLVGGQWKNMGESLAATPAAAREQFARKKDRLWQHYCDDPNVGRARVVERVLKQGPVDGAIDFETGQLFSRSDDWPQGFRRRLARLRKLGVDAICDDSRTVSGLAGLDVIVVPLPDEAWERLHLSNMAEKDFVREGIPGAPVFISARGDLPATFLVKTREGSVGMLQILDFPEEPRGVRIRYKLASWAAGTPE